MKDEVPRRPQNVTAAHNTTHVRALPIFQVRPPPQRFCDPLRRDSPSTGSTRRSTPTRIDAHAQRSTVPTSLLQTVQYLQRSTTTVCVLRQLRRTRGTRNQSPTVAFRAHAWVKIQGMIVNDKASATGPMRSLIAADRFCRRSSSVPNSAFAITTEDHQQRRSRTRSKVYSFLMRRKASPFSAGILALLYGSSRTGSTPEPPQPHRLPDRNWIMSDGRLDNRSHLRRASIGLDATPTDVKIVATFISVLKRRCFRT